MTSVIVNAFRPRRKFAPLKPAGSTPEENNAPPLKGIAFDVDGTLCEMRAALGINKSVDILEHIRNLPTPEDRTTAAAKVKAIEQEAMVRQQPQPGLVELMDYLESRGMRRALCTRNFEGPVTHLLQNHLPKHVFLPIITRDTPNLLPKPDPAGILHIAREWGLENRAESLIMVGDSIDDMTAGYGAGAATVLILNAHNSHLKDHEYTDLWVERLDDLIEILEQGFIGRGENGKDVDESKE